MKQSFPENWKTEPFFKEQIFTYLGNKRKLLPLVYQALLESGVEPQETLFIDLFTGSGVVSRLAKKMNFHTIYSNDWEDYSAVTQQLYLIEDPQSILTLFKEQGGLENVLNQLNNISVENYKNFYMSRYYAPQDLVYFDTKKERLFFTPSNAQKIDAIRETIEQWYPKDKKLTKQQMREKNILLALLIYKASVHNNTSGVFKAYYKDFGGYGHHSLKRILSPLKLEMPILITGTKHVKIFMKDALKLVRNLPTTTSLSTLAYLDPPYNVHQYGSNYHILNTIVRWDKINMDATYTPEGLLKDKAGIRKDWIDHKSTFCSTFSAIESFTQLIKNLNVDVILVSYSIDGIIPFEKMLEILLRKGKVTITMNPYTTYRGGKKSRERKNHNIEFILTVQTRTLAPKSNRQKILDAVHRQIFYMNLKGFYQKQHIQKNFIKVGETFVWKGDNKILLKLTPWGEFEDIEGMGYLSHLQLEKLTLVLNQAVCKNKSEELIELIKRFHYIQDLGTKKESFKRIFNVLKNLAHPKNQKEFNLFYEKVNSLIMHLEAKTQQQFAKKLSSLYNIFGKRNQFYENR